MVAQDGSASQSRDGFLLAPHDPLEFEHDLIDQLLKTLGEGRYARWNFSLEESKPGKLILELKPEKIGLFVFALAIRLSELAKRIEQFNLDPPLDYHEQVKGWDALWAPNSILTFALRDILEERPPLTREQLLKLLDWVGNGEGVATQAAPISSLSKSVERYLKENELDSELQDAISRYCTRIRHYVYDNRGCRRNADRLARLAGIAEPIPISAGEAWSDCAIADMQSLTGEDLEHWANLLQHCLTATTAKPSAKWLKTGRVSVASIGSASFQKALTDWLPLVDRPRTQSIERVSQSQADPNYMLLDSHIDILRGLVWLAVDGTDPALARALGGVAISAYRKVPGIGPRATRLGNAAVYALGQMQCRDALAQLAFLKVKIKFGTALKEIDKALTAAAEREGLPREEIEEMAVPGYGLTEIGKRIEQLGDFRAELVVTGTTSTELRWFKPDGKQQKSVPAAVKEHHAEDLKELKAAAKDIEKMLPAQRDRIDQLYMEQKTWAYSTWAERYLSHPLVGTLARRLIWEFDQGEKRPRLAATWLDGQLVDSAAKAVEVDEASAIVSLWHPIDRSTDDVLAWRKFFEEREIKQPFKQAHREVYLLTDAERNTRVYSNRYAAHVIRQHQFNALCGIRGWKNKLRLMVDDEYPPATRELVPWNLRAEFWIEGAGDDYGTDTNESGTYLYLITDQVRFYHREAAQSSAHAGGGGYNSTAAGPGNESVNEPLPLDQIPPLVFSEVMREVDLFVGVASVGNNPEWQDGGPEGRYRDYWNTFSFGDLSGTAQTRKEILSRLVPRLKIADRCSFDDKFLIVRGDRRTYKIHMGSGNILMEPNDQYLCIVASRGQASAAGGKVFLPFEGDERLAVILSKAFLLAEDTKITDATILSQIGR